MDHARRSPATFLTFRVNLASPNATGGNEVFVNEELAVAAYDIESIVIVQDTTIGVDFISDSTTSKSYDEHPSRLLSARSCLRRWQEVCSRNILCTHFIQIKSTMAEINNLAEC
jgi:hypothetical protein